MTINAVVGLLLCGALVGSGCGSQQSDVEQSPERLDLCVLAMKPSDFYERRLTLKGAVKSDGRHIVALVNSRCNFAVALGAPEENEDPKVARLPTFLVEAVN